MKLKLAGAIAAALLVASPALAQRAACHRGASFEQWLEAFKREAVAEGVSQRTIAAASHLMVYDQTVVNKDRGQKVFSQTFLEFSDRMVARHRIDGGIQRIAKNRPLFGRVEQQFGVPAPVIAAFWALETDFGGFMGNLPTIKSVTSLAYDCRRPDLFRKQLLASLKIVERGDLAADQMIGPFAGELGQFQFLPAHYFDYGVDYDGDGRRDLIRSTPDAVASAGQLSVEDRLEARPALARRGARAGADGLGAGRSRDPASAHAMGALGRHKSRRQPDRRGRAAGLAAAADGTVRAGVPRLSELPGVSGVESVDRLFDLGRLSGDADQRRACDEARHGPGRAVRLGADPRVAAIAGAARA